MGQTLSHGVYLPAEGERNCYSGLASNWNLLDTAIGDTAGKASATHTHGNITNDGKVGTTANLPLITGTGGVVQAGSFGNAANTFCEGNDSRLSDARTPVAHTHATSEVLKTGSAFTGGTVTNPYFKIASWEIGANQYFGAILLVQNLNYPRNQAFVNIEIRTLSNYNFQTGYLYLSNDCGISKESLCICYKQESNKLLCELYYYDTASWNGISFSVLNESLRYGGSTLYLFQTMTVYNQEPTDAVANLPAGYTVIQANYMPLFQNIIPGVNNTYDLGSSSYKWKTLNGINPGALSLPSGGTIENTDWYNVAGDILPTGGNATSFSSATANYFTPAKAGWLALAVKNCSELSVWCETLKYGISIVAPDTSLNRQVVIPVVAGKSYQILITGNSWASARLIMPQGNV